MEPLRHTVSDPRCGAPFAEPNRPGSREATRRRHVPWLTPWAAAVGVALALCTAPVVAAPAPASSDDVARRAAALELGSEGLALYEQERYAEALEKFERANELLPAPTLGIRMARCLAKLGRLVEASERYVEVTRFPLGDQPPRVQIEAVRQARRELDELLERIPTLTVKVPGADPDSLRVEVDDEDLPEGLIGYPQPMDPGKHRVVVVADGAIVDERPSLEEGERATLVVRGVSRANAPVAQRRRKDYRDWAWGAFAVGGVGMTLGVINGAVAVAQNDALEERCPARSCPPNAHADADRYDTARYVTTGSFIVGGLGLAVGALLIGVEVFAPDETAPAEDRPRPWARQRLSPSANGVEIAF